MEPSGQQSPVPQYGPTPGVAPAAPPSYGSAYGSGPLQGPTANAVNANGQTPIDGHGAPMYPQPMRSFGGVPSGIAGMPPISSATQPQSMNQQAQQAMADDASVDVADSEWVNRARRVVAGTHGDPHRQVQLIQHLRSQYLKQRYGRTVQTDEA
jgi:hypothetical protein